MGITNFEIVEADEFRGAMTATPGSVGTDELADGSVTPVKSAQLEAVTATADGLTTGLISATARHITVTSANSSHIVTLPASVVGKEISGYVATNGFRLQTTASSNITINGIDADGTSFYNISADSYFVVRCVSATAWIVYVMNTTGGLSSGNIGNSSISPSKIVESQSVTATADGTGSGSISIPQAFRKIVTATSANATDQIALPSISAGTIGQEVWISVGANGYELITPASSNNTINSVDADGTNQLDVAANTTLWCTQVSATGWVATVLATIAPDND